MSNRARATNAPRIAWEAAAAGDTDAAREVVRAGCPFKPVPRHRRRYSDTDRTRTSIRDGFVDRYSGDRLMFTGAVLLLSRLLAEEFPYHAAWKRDARHAAYWDLYATIHHVHPSALGGSGGPENWVTTSMRRNGMKYSWTLDELGWELQPPGDITVWDGQLSWFVELIATDEFERSDALDRWHRSALRAMDDPLTHGP